ncbi:MAG: hypothetical protein ACLUOI_16460 [Eisenbergiella sp.]
MDAQNRKPEESSRWQAVCSGWEPRRRSVPVDLEELKALKERTGEWNLIYSTPEAYFA